MTTADPGMLGQVDRIAQSDTLRNSAGLQKLLRFLGEKSASGEADHLKEYVVGVDGLGRPPTYDPRHDAAVRIQVGRLRQKLAEYYRTEGSDDPLVLDLPKGQFRLVCEVRHDTPKQSAPPAAISHPGKSAPWLTIALVGVTLCFALSLFWAFNSRTRLNNMARQATRSEWGPTLAEFWQPFIASDRPAVVLIADPLFVHFKGFGAYRTPVVNSWEKVVSSPDISAIRKALNDPPIEPSARYTGLSEANASFLLGTTLATHVPHISLARSSQLSWPQLASNNIIYVGAEKLIEEQLENLPVDWQFTYDYYGVQNRHPRQGEPKVFADSPAMLINQLAENGESYALISRIPGPAGQGEMQAFMSNYAPSRLAVVQIATSAERLGEVMERLKARSGEIPRYYQIVFRVKFRGGIPTETSFVVGRELHSATQSRQTQ
ncbi:MAG: hypothetical protein JO323_04830 [Acidobacteriia bacterium]|nr:hypothetical protein [Terriglobia bacterium]